MPFIKNLQEFLYMKLSEESKKKDLIKICSYATGSATVETLFAIYLKEVHGKKCDLIFADVIDTSELINSYRLFNNPVINIYFTTADKDPRMKFFAIEKVVKKEEIKKKHTDILKNLYCFDIFITNNGQKYHFSMVHDKYSDFNTFYNSPDNYYPKQISQREIEILYEIVHNANDKLKLIYKLINFLMPIDIQHSTPMIWLQWEPELDLSNVSQIELSSRRMLENVELQKKWKIPPEYVISTIDNINKIFKIPE